MNSNVSSRSYLGSCDNCYDWEVFNINDICHCVFVHCRVIPNLSTKCCGRSCIYLCPGWINVSTLHCRSLGKYIIGLSQCNQKEVRVIKRIDDIVYYKNYLLKHVSFIFNQVFLKLIEVIQLLYYFSLFDPLMILSMLSALVCQIPIPLDHLLFPVFVVCIFM